MKYLRNTKPKNMKKELGENKGEPKPKKKGVELKQFPRKPTEVPEMPIGEDLESCERNIKFLQKEEKNKLVNQCIKKILCSVPSAFGEEKCHQTISLPKKTTTSKLSCACI